MLICCHLILERLLFVFVFLFWKINLERNLSRMKIQKMAEKNIKMLLNAGIGRILFAGELRMFLFSTFCLVYRFVQLCWVHSFELPINVHSVQYMQNSNVYKSNVKNYTSRNQVIRVKPYEYIGKSMCVKCMCAFTSTTNIFWDRIQFTHYLFIFWNDYLFAKYANYDLSGCWLPINLLSFQSNQHARATKRKRERK